MLWGKSKKLFLLFFIVTQLPAKETKSRKVISSLSLFNNFINKNQLPQNSSEWATFKKEVALYFSQESVDSDEKAKFNSALKKIDQLRTTLAPESAESACLRNIFNFTSMMFPSKPNDLEMQADLDDPSPTEITSIPNDLQDPNIVALASIGNEEALEKAMIELNTKRSASGKKPYLYVISEVSVSSQDHAFTKSRLIILNEEPERKQLISYTLGNETGLASQVSVITNQTGAATYLDDYNTSFQQKEGAGQSSYSMPESRDLKHLMSLKPTLDRLNYKKAKDCFSCHFSGTPLPIKDPETSHRLQEEGYVAKPLSVEKKKKLDQLNDAILKFPPNTIRYDGKLLIHRSLPLGLHNPDSIPIDFWLSSKDESIAKMAQNDPSHLKSILKNSNCIECHDGVDRGILKPNAIADDYIHNSDMPPKANLSKDEQKILSALFNNDFYSVAPSEEQKHWQVGSLFYELNNTSCAGTGSRKTNKKGH